MSSPDATVTTTTTVDAHTEEEHDGVLPEPERKATTPLWYMLIGCLCLILLALAFTFVYLAIQGTIDSAALVGIFMGVLASTMELYRRRKG